MFLKSEDCASGLPRDCTPSPARADRHVRSRSLACQQHSSGTFPSKRSPNAKSHKVPRRPGSSRNGIFSGMSTLMELAFAVIPLGGSLCSSRVSDRRGAKGHRHRVSWKSRRSDLGFHDRLRGGETRRSNSSWRRPICFLLQGWSGTTSQREGAILFLFLRLSARIRGSKLRNGQVNSAHSAEGQMTHAPALFPEEAESQAQCRKVFPNLNFASYPIPQHWTYSG